VYGQTTRRGRKTGSHKAGELARASKRRSSCPQHLSTQAGSTHQGTQESLPRRSDMTSGDSSAHAHWAAAVTRASLDMGHVRYHTKGYPSTQGSCNPHHAPGSADHVSDGMTTRRVPPAQTPMNGALRPISQDGSDVAAAVNV
jgi:hypothetical protein